jgi:putative lysine transport system permease protein
MDGADSYELVQNDQLTMTAGTYSHPQKGSPFDELDGNGDGKEGR